MKKALITGITGQDGSYLAELLLEKGYEVHGVVRRHAVELGKYSNIKNIIDKVNLHNGDLTDESSIFNIIKEVKPDEVYNLAAQSHVRISSDMPIYTTKVDALGVVSILEAIRQIKPNCKFYQASSSEMFGNSSELGMQDEGTPMHPVSPYACAKLFGHHITCHYRNAYNIFACSGILFNHESPRRGEEFVTQKIITGAVNILYKKQDYLYLGNLDSYRDWSHAKDMVRGMWMMMNHHTPDDFVLASGKTHSVRQFCDIVFTKLGLGSYEQYVKIDPKFFRPQELQRLNGDSTKAKRQLGWTQEYNFEELVEDMIHESLLKFI